MSFTFKRFTVEDDMSTMKVGTDAVLLGSWVDVGDAAAILDIGTGSGVIALMLAQRSKAGITAIEIDRDSAIQAGLNFSKSPWSSRLKAIQTPLQEWVQEARFSLIVSNPPYFVNQLKSTKALRNISGHNVFLDYDDLLLHTYKLLDEDGRFSLILPFEEAYIFRNKALLYFFHPLRMTSVFPKPGMKPKRMMMEYSKHRPLSVNEGEIIIRNDDGSWHRDYLDLTRDFYLFA